MKLFTTCLTLLCLAGIGQAQQQTVFKAKVFSLATTTGVSGPMPNIGQAVHIVSAVFPTASSDLSDFIIRVEGSFDNTTYFPISEDITTATYTGSYAYVLNRCNGVYPFVRINYADASAEEVTINYTGSIQPIGQIRLTSGRYIAESPLLPTTVSGICTTIENNCYIDGHKVVPVIPADWTSVNLQTDVRTNGDGFITMYRANGNSNGYAMVCKSLPGPTFDIVLTMDRDQQIYGSDSQSPAAFILRESATGKMATYTFQGAAVGGHSFSREYWNSPTSYANGTSPAAVTPMRLLQLRITQGATTRSYSVPNRAGTVWSQLSAFGQADANGFFFTTAPDQVCFGILGTNGNYATFASFIGYEVLP